MTMTMTELGTGPGTKWCSLPERCCNRPSFQGGGGGIPGCTGAEISDDR